jgi:streptogramin lyase
VAVDAAGNVYVADTNNYTIRKISPDGFVTTLAGTAGSPGSADGSGAAVSFNFPAGVAVDAAGNVYVADTDNHTIRKITSAGVVTTLAGTALSQGSADGIGAAARFDYPQGVAVDAGNVYVADRDNYTIRKITSAGVVTTLAGTAGNQGPTDGTGAAARFDYPHGVAVDAAGNVYVADTDNHAIRKISPAGVVTTLAGAASNRGSADGPGATAGFNSPYGVAVDAAGNVYVADTSNHLIRKIN